MPRRCWYRTGAEPRSSGPPLPAWLLTAVLGAAGREAARARWDWSRQEDRTLRVLDEAARPGLRKVGA